jgi:hypothetical protein
MYARQYRSKYLAMHYNRRGQTVACKPHAAPAAYDKETLINPYFHRCNKYKKSAAWKACTYTPVPSTFYICGSLISENYHMCSSDIQQA